MEPTTAASAPAPTMTVAELARRLGIDESTARRRLRDGALPGLKLGAAWVIDRARVERFVAGREDAQGRPLVADPAPASAMPELSLLPARPADPARHGLDWLRGLHAALDLLLATADVDRARDRAQPSA